jgi:hypothetical protein
MATTRPFAYNTGTTIFNTDQIGSIAIGVGQERYDLNYGGVKWWNGPDEDLGYVITHTTTGGTQPNPDNVPAYIGFWRSKQKTENSFVSLSNYVARGVTTFSNGNDATLWLTGNGYWTSYIYSAATSGQPYTQLSTIATYLRNYMSDFRNPNFYTYRLDGDGFYILDGGLDMYDNGNITTPWLNNGALFTGTTGYSSAAYPSAITYTNTATTVIDTDLSYISLGYIQAAATQNATYHPLTVLSSRSVTGKPVGWQIGGNSGADGGGTLASGLIYSGTNLSGFTTYAFFRETYNAVDPSHCNLFILLGHSNWNSVFGNVISFGAQPVSVGGCGGFLYTSGASTSNILSIQTLLSKQSGVLVTSGECQTVVQNFVRRIKESLNY